MIIAAEKRIKESSKNKRVRMEKEEKTRQKRIKKVKKTESAIRNNRIPDRDSGRFVWSPVNQGDNG